MDKLQISEHLRDSLTREDLSNRQAAELLGIKPQYVSMALNVKMHDSMSKEAWERLNEWHESREKLNTFTCSFEKLVETSDVAVISEGKKQPEPKQEKKKPVKVSKPKVKQKSDPDKIQREAFKEARRNASKHHASFPVKPLPKTEEVQFTDTARLKVALDLEINLVVNGQKVQVR